jgi:hypothetical protein
MSAEFEQGPSSISEFAVGAIALAAVALVTFFGVQTSPPTASPTPAVRSSETTASVVVAAPIPTAPAPVEPARPPVATDSSDADGPSTRPSIPPTATNPFGTEGTAAAQAEAPGRSRPYDAMRAQPPTQPTETMATRPETERDLVNRFDVISIQTKLRELGYYLAESDGVWGPGARRALHDFKVMNGLPENEQWDRETEERLWSGRGVPAASTFIGIWGRDAAECRNRAGEDQRIKIDSRGAESAGTKCDFRSVNQEAAGRWQVRALCSAGRDLWTSNVSLKLAGSNLRWSSERGTDTYLRCGRPSSMISSR